MKRAASSVTSVVLIIPQNLWGRGIYPCNSVEREGEEREDNLCSILNTQPKLPTSDLVQRKEGRNKRRREGGRQGGREAGSEWVQGPLPHSVTFLWPHTLSSVPGTWNGASPVSPVICSHNWAGGVVYLVQLQLNDPRLAFRSIVVLEQSGSLTRSHGWPVGDQILFSVPSECVGVRPFFSSWEFPVKTLLWASVSPHVSHILTCSYCRGESELFLVLLMWVPYFSNTRECWV